MATAVHTVATHTAAAHTGAAPTAVPMAAVLGGCMEAPRMAEDPWGAATAAMAAAACTGGLWARGMGEPMVAGTGQPMAAAMLTEVVMVPAWVRTAAVECTGSPTAQWHPTAAAGQVRQLRLASEVSVAGAFEDL